MITLEGLQLLPATAGWLTARHADTVCGHIHVAITDRDFPGVPVGLRQTVTTARI